MRELLIGLMLACVATTAGAQSEQNRGPSTWRSADGLIHACDLAAKDIRYQATCSTIILTAVDAASYTASMILIGLDRGETIGPILGQILVGDVEQHTKYCPAGSAPTGQEIVEEIITRIKAKGYQSDEPAASAVIKAFGQAPLCAKSKK